MGVHLPDLLIVVAVGLLLFGPKTLQSLSRTAGRGMGQAKQLKDKVVSELPVEELAQLNKTISSIPTSPQQVAQKLVTQAVSSALKSDAEKPTATSRETSAVVEGEAV